MELNKNINSYIKDKRINKESGITLIALVITIIVLLILAGVALASLSGENGLLTRVSKASEEDKYARAEEKVKLAVMASYDETGSLNKQLLKQNINEIEGLYEKVDEVVFDLKITVDGYDFIIKETGEVIRRRKK